MAITEKRGLLCPGSTMGATPEYASDAAGFSSAEGEEKDEDYIPSPTAESSETGNTSPGVGEATTKVEAGKCQSTC